MIGFIHSESQFFMFWKNICLEFSAHGRPWAPMKACFEQCTLVKLHITLHIIEGRFHDGVSEKKIFRFAYLRETKICSEPSVDEKFSIDFTNWKVKFKKGLTIEFGEVWASKLLGIYHNSPQLNLCMLIKRVAAACIETLRCKPQMTVIFSLPPTTFFGRNATPGYKQMEGSQHKEELTS